MFDAMPRQLQIEMAQTVKQLESQLKTARTEAAKRTAPDAVVAQNWAGESALTTGRTAGTRPF